MIHNHDRSGWFGASDTATIMGNWTTTTFMRWWLTKLGVTENHFVNNAMAAGTAYEHRILQAAGITKMDRQIRFRPLRLRVNLDGENPRIISEVKTFSSDRFTVTKAYWEQCQVEMLAAHKECRILAYRLLPEDLENFFNPIGLDRIGQHFIVLDAQWLVSEYVPRLAYLAGCLRRKETPSASGLEAYRKTRRCKAWQIAARIWLKGCG